MADKHINPEEFDKKVMNGELYPVSMSASKLGEQFAKPIIESIKGFNGKDPGFCYTCRCNDMVTAWEFGYTDPKIFSQVNTMVEEQITKVRNRFGLDPNKQGRVSRKYKACVCPFSGAK